MRKSLSFLFLIASTQICFAQVGDLTIDAERVSVDKERHRIEAEGSVEAVYKDFVLYGNHLIYDSSAETIAADRHFTLLYSGLTIEGETLDYELKAARGRATGARFIYRSAVLHGGQISFDREKVEIRNAAFSTCDLAYPHYRVTAADLSLYPDYGWMVAYWGYFWLGNIPVVPMPTYIYDFRAEERAHKNLPPFPEIGQNAEDGNYLNERLAWHWRREFSGTYSLGYAASKGLMFGAAANYVLNDRNEGDIRLDWNPVNQTFGGITHILTLREESGEPSPFALFSQLPRLHVRQAGRRDELEVTLSSRERINYQRVSFLPRLALRSRAAEALFPGLKYDAEITAARVNEDNNIRLFAGGGNVKFYGPLPETPLGVFTPALQFDGVYYSNGSRWLKPSVGLELFRPFSRDFTLNLAYQHYLLIEGQSPFNFELYRYRAADRLLTDWRFKIGETAARIATAHFLDNWSPQDIDYTLFFLLHCYNLEITYRELRRELVVGVSLAAR